VKAISSRNKNVRVVGICDYNPHGLEILLNFRCGSQGSAFDGLGLEVDLQWLGLRSVHFQGIDMTSDTSRGQMLTSKNQAKIDCMLQSKNLQKLPPSYTEELKIMSRGRFTCQLDTFYREDYHEVDKIIVKALQEKDFI
jgi:DNA topoisomerase VI subunit A